MTVDGGKSGSRVALRAGIALTVFVAAAVGLMFMDPGTRYLWIKSLHVIAVISWMAGMLYLPRLFIYHIDSQPESDQARTFSIMEKRLMRIIMTPAMILSWLFGLFIAWDIYGFSGGWLHAKLLAVVLLTATHVYFAKAVTAFEQGRYIKNARFWRLANEIPTILMIFIVIMVIVKPF